MIAIIRRNFALLLSATLACAFLSGLGIWQLRRLKWKEGLLAHIHDRMKAPPSPLPPRAKWATLKPDNYDYRHVVLHGVFDNSKESYLYRPGSTGGRDEGPGYEILTPFRLDSGGIVFINRGFVRLDKKNPATRAAGEIAGETTLTGVMRGPEPRNLFTPADEPAKNLWFTRDPAALAAHWGLHNAAPFSVDADATPVPGGWPQGGATVVSIPNNHFGYAMTWFGLAATLLGITLDFVKRREAERAAHDSIDATG